MDTSLAAITEKIAERGKSFGPPLSESEIRGFELRHDIELPGDYREFLKRIGNGGDGPPAYGLMRLGDVPDRTHPDFARDWRELPNVGRPFPLTKTWAWEGDEYDEARQDAARHGTLNLGHDGCGMYWLLVVTGEMRGQVWAHTDVGVCPQEPGRDFLQWVEAWLDGVWWWT